MSDSTTDHAEQLATLTIIVAALVARLADPQSEKSADEGNKVIDEIRTEALGILATTEINTSEFSRSQSEATENVERRINNIFSSLRFKD